MSALKTIFGKRLDIDWQIAAITVGSTLLIMVDHYYSLTPYYYLDRFLLYLVIPVAVIVVVFRESPRDYGFSKGDWRAGVVITISAALILGPIIFFLGRENSAIQEYYASNQLDGLLGKNFLELLGWEFIFRGWILFGYARKFGHNALWLQAVPFAIAHLGKPELETLSTIFGGFAFGWVAWRTRSFFYSFLIHLFIGTLIVTAASSGG